MTLGFLLAGCARRVRSGDEVVVEQVVGVVEVKVLVQSGHDVGVHVQTRSCGETQGRDREGSFIQTAHVGGQTNSSKRFIATRSRGTDPDVNDGDPEQR